MKITAKQKEYIWNNFDRIMFEMNPLLLKSCFENGWSSWLVRLPNKKSVTYKSISDAVLDFAKHEMEDSTKGNGRNRNE